MPKMSQAPVGRGPMPIPFGGYVQSLGNRPLPVTDALMGIVPQGDDKASRR